MWQYDYYDALEVAAKAGDSESAFQLARYHGTKWSTRVVGDKLEIWGADHFQLERDYLSAAVHVRHPGAQKELAGHLLRGHPGFGYKPITGLKLWLAGHLGEYMVRRNQNDPLEARLNSLASLAEPRDSLIGSGRMKLNYRGAVGKQATCGVRYQRSDEYGVHVVIEQIHGLSLPSVINAEMQIATKVLYLLLLEGERLNPEEVHWYVAIPSNSSSGMVERGSLQQVRFTWSGVGYSKPRYEPVSPTDVPIDLSDIIGGSE